MGQDAKFVNRTVLVSEVDRRLVSYCEQQTHAAQAVDLSFGRLWQSISHVIGAGGKRLRPYMVVLGYQLYGGSDDGSFEAVMPVALGQELLHVALLIHDDIMDEALVRHGVSNVSGQYVDYYKSIGLDGPAARRHADAAALLAGDVLLSAAQSLVLAAGFPAERQERLRQLFEEAMFHVTAGQLLDMEAGQPIAYQVPAETIARHKTASYSFVGPLRSGAAAAGADELALAALAEFGTTLGLAYQLADDLDGAFGDSHKIGKSTVSDFRDGKRTLLVQVAFERADEQQRAILDKYFGSADLDEDGAAKLRSVIEATGAKSTAETALADYYQQALDQVDAIIAPVTDAGRQALRDLVKLVLPRVKQ